MVEDLKIGDIIRSDNETPYRPEKLNLLVCYDDKGKYNI